MHLQTRYVKLSTDISTGMYDLQDSSYPYFQRLDTSGYVIPSENEWVKAAYYSPIATGNGTHYYYYPTVSNTPPTALHTGNPNPTVDRLGNVIESNLVPGVAYSNYDETVIWQPPYDPESPTNGANVVSVGEDHTPSPWLTYDQGGNAVEYTDTVAAPVAGVANPRDLPVFVKVHGGIANAGTYQLWLTATGTSDPYGQDLGQTNTQGGARFGYVPDAHAHRLIRSSKGVSSSALAKPLTSNGLVYRLDNLNTLDTFYTTDLTKAISLANDQSTYVFLGASFKQPVHAGAKPVYGFLNTTTRTQFYTIDPREAAAASANPRFASEGIVFTALPPNVGSTNFRRFFNSETGAYAYSAANADVQFFTSRGYKFDGYAWSVSWPARSSRFRCAPGAPHVRSRLRGWAAPGTGGAWSKNVSRSRMIAWGMSWSLWVETPACLRMAVPMAITSTSPAPSSLMKILTPITRVGLQLLGLEADVVEAVLAGVVDQPGHLVDLAPGERAEERRERRRRSRGRRRSSPAGGGAGRSPAG